jgi:NAD(P)-dependent dehydrogenase (short-subunit alcohol dehydrogenase family)
VTASERLPDFPRSGCAVVIGGSGGIGRAIALQLAERGCDIALAPKKRQPAFAAPAARSMSARSICVMKPC